MRGTRLQSGLDMHASSTQRLRNRIRGWRATEDLSQTLTSHISCPSMHHRVRLYLVIPGVEQLDRTTSSDIALAQPEEGAELRAVPR